MTKNIYFHNAVKSKKLIFWDFDGVIKDSVEAKAQCFLELFKDCSQFQKTLILNHHLNNGGMSRFEKLPIYMDFCNINYSQSSLDLLLERLSVLMVDSVVRSEWVPGFLDFFLTIPPSTINVVVTGTPSAEMITILNRLDIRSFFSYVYGSPDKKVDSISNALLKYSLTASDCMMVGDSRLDLKSSLHHNIDFYLRRHQSNSMISINSKFEFFDYHD